ncbi:MAG: hypothetical protein ACH350_04300 [Parachlamydiaceae bacterium]
MNISPRFPKKKADIISNGLFLIFLGFLFYTGQWWPGILFALGFTFAVRQYLTGRRVDFFLTLLVVAILGFITFAGNIFANLLPLLLIIGGGLVVIKELFLSKTSSEE